MLSNLIVYRAGLAAFGSGGFVVMYEGEAAVAEAAVGGTSARQDMEQFSSGNRADFADFFEPGQEDESSSRAQYP